MKWISKSPYESFHVFNYATIEIFIEQKDVNTKAIVDSITVCRRHGYGQGVKAKAVYFLRGESFKDDYTEVLVGVLEVKQLPPELYEIIHCLRFWNNEGKKCFEMNGEKGEQYQDFILRCIAADCRAFVEPHPELFITGRGGRHVWVTDLQTGERILIIHF